MGKVRAGIAAGVALGVACYTPAVCGELKLPPEVTPALRAACEADVRKICIKDEDDATVSSVRQCVHANFMKLGMRCRMQITIAGLAP